METRAAIGEVWIDRDGHGVQRQGDVGLAGIDIWTEDGQVATTDSTGKFSFANLRPGGHAFRVDPRTLPQGFSVAGDEIQAVEASGWTTPQVDFRVVPSGAHGADALRETPRTAAPQPESAAEISAVVHLKFAAVRVRGSRVPVNGLVRPQLRYEVTVKKDTGLPLDAMVEFSPVADSALVFVGDTQFTSYAWADRTAIPLPVGRPRSDFRIVAWSSVRGDSATATLRVGKSRWPVRVRVDDASQPDAASSWTTLVVRQTRPDYSALSGQVVEAAREPLPVPDGSRPGAEAPRLGESPLSDPVTVPRARPRAVTSVGHA